MKPEAETALRRWRLEQGYSLEEVSGLTGLAVSVVSRVERGLHGLKPATKVRVARRLGEPVGVLFPIDAEPVEVA